MPIKFGTTKSINLDNEYLLNKKLGILGGGQLGKMLCLEAARLDLDLSILDKDASFPAAKLCKRFVEGDFKNYEDVMAFGRTVDILTIEIESVNIQALKDLKAEGKIIHPDPYKLEIIKDKKLQKEFYVKNQFPTSVFKAYKDASDVKEAYTAGAIKLPFVQKARKDGYDGRGVQVVNKEADLALLLDVPCIVEPKVDIAKEIAVIVARNDKDDVKTFPAVEMEFNPHANLVEYLHCPSYLDDIQEAVAQKLARDIIRSFDICGLLAVEMFLTNAGNILINEVAPRPHNSGHHTIDSSATSQFEQHLRAIYNMPLGSTKTLSPAVMVNLLGEDKEQGPVKYCNIDQVMELPGVHLMLYGKTETRPFRKMGHATVVASNLNTARSRAEQVKRILKIKSF